jgi:hypothetical protein
MTFVFSALVARGNEEKSFAQKITKIVLSIDTV